MEPINNNSTTRNQSHHQQSLFQIHSIFMLFHSLLLPLLFYNTNALQDNEISLLLNNEITSIAGVQQQNVPTQVNTNTSSRVLGGQLQPQQQFSQLSQEAAIRLTVISNILNSTQQPLQQQPISASTRPNTIASNNNNRNTSTNSSIACNTTRGPGTCKQITECNPTQNQLPVPLFCHGLPDNIQCCVNMTDYKVPDIPSGDKCESNGKQGTCEHISVCKNILNGTTVQGKCMGRHANHNNVKCCLL